MQPMEKHVHISATVNNELYLYYIKQDLKKYSFIWKAKLWRDREEERERGIERERDLPSIG